MNSVKRLYVDLRSGSGFAKANISLHKDVDHVIVRKSPSFTDTDVAIQEADSVIALEAVASLENLTKLDLVDFDGGSLPVRGLAVVFQKAKNLEILRLDSVRIAGSKEDFVEFVKELKGHPSLSELHLVGCLPSTETEMIQSMAEALSGLKTLKVLEIVETRFSPYGAWSGRAMATLCRSPTLKALRVRGVHFLKDDHIIMAAQALKTSQSVEELSLLCDIGEASVEALCEMLRFNQSLKVLCLNRILEGKQCSDIAKALVTNTTLQALHLYFKYCSVDLLRSSFLELMERNYTLVKLAGGWTCPKLDLFLRLNTEGRKRVMNDGGKASPSDWTDLMAKLDDQNATFYLLSQNPNLCGN